MTCGRAGARQRDQRQGQQDQQAGLGDAPRAQAQRQHRQQQRRGQAAELTHRVQRAQHGRVGAVERELSGDDGRPGSGAQIERENRQQNRQQPPMSKSQEDGRHASRRVYATSCAETKECLGGIGVASVLKFRDAGIFAIPRRLPVGRRDRCAPDRGQQHAQRLVAVGATRAAAVPLRGSVRFVEPLARRRATAVRHRTERVSDVGRVGARRARARPL